MAEADACNRVHQQPRDADVFRIAVRCSGAARPNAIDG